MNGIWPDGGELAPYYEKQRMEQLRKLMEEDRARWAEAFKFPLPDNLLGCITNNQARLYGEQLDQFIPEQKPGRSEQTVCTPPEFLSAVRSRLGITDFAWDLAADKENSVCDGGRFYNEEMDALIQPWNLTAHSGVNWNWCNPPYARLGDWVKKAWNEVAHGAMTAMLVPAAPGSNWWREWVFGKAYITYLNGRITFVGHTSPYPKDLALLLYAPFLEGSETVWRWKK